MNKQIKVLILYLIVIALCVYGVLFFVKQYHRVEIEPIPTTTPSHAPQTDFSELDDKLAVLEDKLLTMELRASDRDKVLIASVNGLTESVNVLIEILIGGEK